MLKSVGAAVAAVALIASTPSNAACWTKDETAAATIREFQSMLMVATLRCQVAHHDMTAEYNDFLKANKLLIQKQNSKIKAHFVRGSSAAAGQKAYDSFTTHLANGYGADGSSDEVCGNMASLAKEAGLVGGNIDGMLTLATRVNLTTEVPGGTCAAARVALNGRGRPAGER
jgi:hypothetical protein